MASQSQSKYIRDLAVVKTKEFKEVKELLHANNIVGENAEIVDEAQSIEEITNALTDLQASRLIDVLIKAKTPARERTYSQNRVRKTVNALDDIKATIDNWDFS